MKRNPFITGNRVSHGQFINRKAELNSAVSLLLSGQSSAFVGDPRSGKTSLLLYLQEPDLRKELYSEDADKLVFFYIDLQAIPPDLKYTQFWQLALKDYIETIKKKEPRSDVLTAFKTFNKDIINIHQLEDLFNKSQKDGWHLVLLLDEFDMLLHHETLNTTEFYGGLRTLASRFGKALTLVISSRSTLSELNNETQICSRNGSPFFNFIKELMILPFSEKHAIEVLNQSDRKFSSKEKDFLLDLAGNHAYLLQSAGSALWSAYQHGTPPSERLIFAGQELLRSASGHLERIWFHWSPNIRKVFTIISLDEMPTLLGKAEFDIETMRKSLSKYPREIRYLTDRGFIKKEPLLPGGFGVTAKVLLWWLAEELLAALEFNDEVGQLLHKNQWEGMFTKGELDQLNSALLRLGSFAKTGIDTFIKTAAEGFGKGATL